MPRGGLTGGEGGDGERREGEKGRGKKIGGGAELRGSPVSAHAQIWRAALGWGSLISYEIWSSGQ